MGAGARFDGHIVQGHVDGMGRVRRLVREGNEVELHVECDPELAGQLVDKGSVTIDGVSLTVVRVVEDGFHVALIPAHARGHDALGASGRRRRATSRSTSSANT